MLFILRFSKFSSEVLYVLSLSLKQLFQEKNRKRFAPTAVRGRSEAKRRRSDEDPSARPTKVSCNADVIECYIDPTKGSIEHAVTELTEAESLTKSTVPIASTSSEIRPLQDASNASSDEIQSMPCKPKTMDPAEVEMIVRDYLYELRKKRPRRRKSLGISKSALLKRAEEELAEKTRKAAEEEKLKINSLFLELQEENSVAIHSEGEPREILEITDEKDARETLQLLGRARTWTRPWSIEETELFYDLLHEHGLAFHRISDYIPGRTAKHVQKKYKKECNENPIRIQECLKPV
ncbi:hypothetical protein BX666DRAFT_943127 [Dichotomocladium elegans]|nr:hypothetical protein BX666DRAFT_943127 [Dichotomocladium elegans]